MNITEVEQLEATETFTLDWKGQKVTFDVLTSSLTPDFLQNTKSSREFPIAIATYVTDWDVTKDNEGNKWPLTERELARLPVPFLGAVIGKIVESWAGDTKKPQTSPNTSAAAAS